MVQHEVREFYAYSTPLTAVGANGTSNITVSVSQDADFEIHKMMSIETSPNFTVQIQDTATGKSFFDRQINFSTVFGTAQFPFILAIPRMVRANSSLFITITDGSGATNNIQLVFAGYKIRLMDK